MKNTILGFALLVGAAVLSGCSYEDVTNEAGLTTRTWTLNISRAKTEAECAAGEAFETDCRAFTLKFESDCFSSSNQPQECPIFADVAKDIVSCETNVYPRDGRVITPEVCFEKAFERINNTKYTIDQFIVEADEAMENEEYSKAELLYMRAKVGIAKYTFLGPGYFQTYLKASQGLDEARRQQNKYEAGGIDSSTSPSDDSSCDGPPGSLC